MLFPVSILDDLRIAGRTKKSAGARSILAWVCVLGLTGCAQGQDALPQNQVDIDTIAAIPLEISGKAITAPAEANPAALNPEAPSREQILAMATALGNDVSNLTATEASAARPSTTDYPYDIALVASRGGKDTSLLTSAQLLAPHRGKRPVVLMFWMTTCGPCRVELADLEKLMPAWQEAYDFAFVPVSLDFEQRRGAFHQRAAEYPWTSYFDVARAFPSVMPGGLNGVPQTFVFDAEGKQVFYRRKYTSGDLEDLEAVLRGLRG